MRRKEFVLALGFVCAAVTLTLCFIPTLPVTRAAESILMTKEISVGKIPLGSLAATLISSADSKHVAYGVLRGKSAVVVVDGVEGKVYDGVYNLTFSPDGKSVAYAVRRGKKNLLVVDGVEGKEEQSIEDKTVVFSPDGKRTAYQTWHGGKRLFVVDGVEGKEYGQVSSLTFSPDSKHFAYSAELRGWHGGVCVVLDGVEQKVYKEYMLVTNQGTYVNLMHDVVFSPDSKQLAYVATPGRVGAVEPDRAFVVVDGVEGKQYGAASDVVFSPDSKRLAFAAQHRIRGKAVPVVDGVEGKEYDEVYGLAFAPDNMRVAYMTKKQHGKRLVVVDGVEGKEYDTVLNLVFSPDSKRVAHKARRGTKWLVVTDGAEGKEYDGVYDLTFSPDSKHVAYWARLGPKSVVIVVDGVESKEYDGGVANSGLVFDDPNLFHTHALRGGEMFRVEIEIPTAAAETSVPK